MPRGGLTGLTRLHGGEVACQERPERRDPEGFQDRRGLGQAERFEGSDLLERAPLDHGCETGVYRGIELGPGGLENNRDGLDKR